MPVVQNQDCSWTSCLLSNTNQNSVEFQTCMCRMTTLNLTQYVCTMQIVAKMHIPLFQIMCKPPYISNEILIEKFVIWDTQMSAYCVHHILDCVQASQNDFCRTSAQARCIRPMLILANCVLNNASCGAKSHTQFMWLLREHAAIIPEHVQKSLASEILTWACWIHMSHCYESRLPYLQCVCSKFRCDIIMWASCICQTWILADFVCRSSGFRAKM